MRFFQNKLTLYIALLAPVVLIYIQMISHEFVAFDDGVLIRYNHMITGDNTTFNDLITRQLWQPHYKPIIYLMWYFEWQFIHAPLSAKYDWWSTSNNAGLFLMINLLVHLCNTALLYLIGLHIFEKLKLTSATLQWAAFTAALFFGIHPLHVESVAWATERKDVMFTLFFFIGWLIYIKYINTKHYKWLGISVVCYLLAILSKSMAITFFAVLFLTDWLYQRKLKPSLLLEKIPHAIVLFFGFWVFGLLSKFTEHTGGLTSGIIHNFAQDFPPNIEGLPGYIARILVGSSRFLMWIAHIIVPVNMATIYPRMELLETPGVLIHLFPLITAALFIIAFLYRKKTMAPIWGLVVFTITLLPALSVSDTGTGVFLSDRYTYLPSVGLFFIFSYWLFSLRRKKTTFILATAISIWWCFGTFNQVKAWENSIALNTATLKVNPSSWVSYTNRGREYRKKADQSKKKGKQTKAKKYYKLAFKDYDNAIRVNPKYHLAHNNRGKLHYDHKNYKQAIIDLTNSIKYKKDFSSSYSNRGAVYGTIGQYDKALTDLKKAVELNHKDINSLSNLAVLLRLQKKFKESIEHWTKCHKLRPNDPTYPNEISFCYLKLKDYKKTAEWATKAIKIKKNFTSSYANRATANYYLKKYQHAYRDAQTAKKLGFNVNPKFIDTLEKLLNI